MTTSLIDTPFKLKPMTSEEYDEFKSMEEITTPDVRPENQFKSHGEYMLFMMGILHAAIPQGHFSIYELIGLLESPDILEWTNRRHEVSESNGRDPIKLLFSLLEHVPSGECKETLLLKALITLLTCDPQRLSDIRFSWREFHDWFNAIVLVDGKGPTTGWRKRAVDIFMNPNKPVQV